MLRLLSRFLRSLFQFSKRAPGEATKFGRSGVKLLGVVGAARLECSEPAAESGELIRRQLGNSLCHGVVDMANGQVVLVTTEGLSGGSPMRTVYYVAEEDPTKAQAIIAEIMAPNEKLRRMGCSQRPPLRPLD